MSLTRRTFIRNSALTFSSLAIASNTFSAHRSLDDLPYRMTPIRRNIGYFTERGGTIAWLISKDGIVVVDSQFPEQSNNLIAAIGERSDRRIDLLINTHHHGDHSGGNISFKDKVGKVLAHENSKKNQMRVAKEREREDSQLYPDTTYDKSWSGKYGDESVALTYFGRAHTDGDSIIHFEEANVAHMGDLVFNRRYPYIDRSAGASIGNWIEVLGNAQKKFDKDTFFVFGHSGEGYQITGKLEDLKAKQDYLSRLLEMVDQQIKAGKNEDEILKIQSIKGADQWKGRGLERNLTAAYQELSEMGD